MHENLSYVPVTDNLKKLQYNGAYNCGSQKESDIDNLQGFCDSSANQMDSIYFKYLK